MKSDGEAGEIGAVQIRLVGPEDAVRAAARALEGLVHGVAGTDGGVHVLLITELRKGRDGDWIAYGAYKTAERKAD